VVAIIISLTFYYYSYRPKIMNSIPFTFDTLIYSKKLQEKGFTAEQAEAQVEMIKEIIDSQLATKLDIQDLKRDIQDVKNELIIKLGATIIGSVTALGIFLAVLANLH